MILDYKNAKTWDPIINNILAELLGVTYPGTIKKNAEKILYRDSDSEACSLFDHTSRDCIRDVVIKELGRNFEEVLVYHACRPIRVDDYYKKGIMPLSPADAQNQFRNRFSSYSSQSDIDQAIAAIALDTRRGIVHACLDDRGFVNKCGHYLIYGGEYQNCLAIHLPGASEYTRDILKQFGNATVFVCRLPFSHVTDLEYLASSMIADHCFRLAHDSEDVCEINYTVFIKEAVPPDAIVRHYYPNRIRDPYKNFMVWNDKSMEYESAQRFSTGDSQN
jgi:hypothetical protein